MIVRTSFKCLTCGQAHTLRIGLGQEDRQEHRFPCTACHEQIAIALHLDHAQAGVRIEAIDNTEAAAEVEGAPIVNLEANFIVPEHLRHKDMVFPRVDQIKAITDAAQKAGRAMRPAVFGPLNQLRPFRRPDFHGEWQLLKKAWSLRRNKHDKLSNRKIKEANAALYAGDQLKSFDDWLFRFTTSLCGSAFQEKFVAVVEQVQPLLEGKEFGRFLAAYDAIKAERGTRYFDLVRTYFSAYSDFAQVLYLVSQGVAVPAQNAASNVNYDATRMFYGNAFEAFASSVDVLAYINNISEGRAFDEFKSLSRDQYLKLDKAGRCIAFAGNPSLTALCTEFDNQLRNASHHGGFTYDPATQLITYRAGKGGMGEEHLIYYVSYLARSTTLFLQALTLYRFEILMCHVTDRPCAY